MRLIRLLVLICLGVALLSWLQTGRQQELRLETRSLAADTPLARGPAAFPLVVGGDSRQALHVAFTLPGEAVTADLIVEASNPDFEVIDAGGGRLETRCESDGTAGSARCTTRLHFGTSDQYVTILARDPITLTGVTTDIWAAKRVARTGMLSVVAALLLLLVAAPLFWRANRTVAQYALIGLGALWLLVASWQLALTLAALLVLTFIVLRLMMGGADRARWFAIGILLTVGALLTVKAIVPLAAQFFANPGEFFFLPLGFSYFVIRLIDLLFKAHARQLREISAREYFAYLLFPPTLAAGPIMNIIEFRAGTNAFATLTDRTWGLLRVGSGLVKKAFADLLMLYVIAPRMDGGFFGPDNSDVTVVLLANVLFVYLDFSAYSDMAIGVARWWGWRVPENFDWPLLRRTMREFWRHWHMSLTQWVTRHVFMQASMEVRRASQWLQATVPTFSTMLVIGLWHAFLFTWVLWALHHLIGIKLGDAILGWAKRPGPAQALDRVRDAIGPAGFSALLRILGIAFVWWWVALSHAFTTTTSVPEALDNYLTMLTLGAV